MGKQELTTTEENKAVSKVSDDAAFMASAEGIGTGLENVTSADVLIPRLAIIQGLSPQVVPNKPEYDPNAKVGQIYDVGLGQGFPSGITIIPIHFSKQWLQWAPRASGKGLVAIHDTGAILDQCATGDGHPTLPNGDLIVETAQFYCFNVTAGMRKSFLPMASTQLKKARRLLSLATDEKMVGSNGKEFTPPLYYRMYNLTTVPESNNDGNWMGWKVERGDPITTLPNWKELMEEIKDFREAITRGRVKGDVGAGEEGAQTVDHENGAM